MSGIREFKSPASLELSNKVKDSVTARIAARQHAGPRRERHWRRSAVQRSASAFLNEASQVGHPAFGDEPVREVPGCTVEPDDEGSRTPSHLLCFRTGTSGYGTSRDLAAVSVDVPECSHPLTVVCGNVRSLCLDLYVHGGLKLLFEEARQLRLSLPVLAYEILLLTRVRLECVHFLRSKTAGIPLVGTNVLVAIGPHAGEDVSFEVLLREHDALSMITQFFASRKGGRGVDVFLHHYGISAARIDLDGCTATCQAEYEETFMGTAAGGTVTLIVEGVMLVVPTTEGQTAGQACKKLGISEQSYYRWRREYGGLTVDQAKRLKDLEKENARLKKLVADQALDNAILKEVSSGNF